MMILVMLPWPFKKIALRPICVILRIVHLFVQSAPKTATSSVSKSKSKSKVMSFGSTLKKHVIKFRRLQDNVDTLV